ncbi:hypothetical protein ANTPLA_LOCUS8246 [Anthophora plagiata]
MESISTILFTLFLVFPLLLQLQMLIVHPAKLFTIFHYYASTIPDDSHKTSSPSILQHYPKEPTVFNASSDSKMSLTTLRNVFSSPVLLNGLSTMNDVNPTSVEKTDRIVPELLTIAKHSSTFVKTDQELPIVDITWNYNSYRYKTFEDCLKNYYGTNYPPGDVLMNYMQLNLLDSRTNVALNVAGMFDFVKENDERQLNVVPRKPEIEYLNPLDHFVARQTDTPPATIERFTETDEVNETSNPRGRSRLCENVICPRPGVFTGRMTLERNSLGARRTHGRFQTAAGCLKID